MASSEKSSEKEKHYPNSRARRHSSEVVVSQSKKKKSKKDKDKDGDTESITSSNSSETVVSSEKKCPFRFMLIGLFEGEDGPDGKKVKSCPLRRVQLWHTIPLCLLAIINLLLVIVALLGLACYRIGVGVRDALVSVGTPENPYDESVADDATVVSSKS